MRILSTVVLLSVVLVSAPGRGEPAPKTPPEKTPARVTFELQETPIRDVVGMIARVSGVPITVDERVQGKITVSLRDVPWSDALDMIAGTLGAGIEEKDGAIRVIPGSRPFLEGRKDTTLESKVPFLSDLPVLGYLFKDHRQKALLRGLVHDAKGQPVPPGEYLLVARGDGTIVVLRPMDGRKAEPVTLRGHILDEKGRPLVEGKYHVLVRDDDSKSGWFAYPHAYGMQSTAVPRRLTDLEAARKHLRAAGMEEEAKRVDRAITRLTASLALANLAGSKDARVLAAVEALRKDVADLRTEVRALTALVREMRR